jgi:hypothetical protein
MDEYGQPTWGLEQVDGLHGDRNITRRPGERLGLGGPHTIVLTVRGSGISASCDGNQVLDWSSDPSRLMPDPAWSVPERADCLLLGARASFRISKLALTPLSEDKGHGQRQSLAANTLTAAEIADGWKQLFDGRSTQGWRCLPDRDPVQGGWSASEGWLKLAEAKDRPVFGNLANASQFTDFDLRFDWRIGPHGNSGVMYGRAFLRPQNLSMSGPEYQILDDPSYGGEAPTSMTAALWGVIAPGPNKHLLPVGQVNRSRILVRGNHVEHWLNGSRLVEYDADSAAFRALVAASRFRETPDFAQRTRSPIVLQDQGKGVWYRNVKIRELPPGS